MKLRPSFYQKPGTIWKRANMSLYCSSSIESLSSPSSEKISLLFFLAFYFICMRSKGSFTVDSEHSVRTQTFNSLQQLLSDPHLPGELSWQYEMMVNGAEVSAALFVEGLMILWFYESGLRSIVHLWMNIWVHLTPKCGNCLSLWMVYISLQLAPSTDRTEI